MYEEQATAVTVGMIAAAVITATAATPSLLPAIALSSTMLFHLERGAACFAVYVFVLVILIRAWRGELPSEMSSQGVKYASPDEQGLAVSTLLAMADRLEALTDRFKEGD
jgi:uncharacterized membrane protein